MQVSKGVTASSPDISRWVYKGLQTDSYDEAGIHRQLTYDALGNLRTVNELGTTANPTNLETDYDYDPQNNLKKITQHGNTNETARIRQFTYDQVGQLTSTQNPESGYICLGTTGGVVPTPSNCSPRYDGNGNLKSKTDARGVTISYSYDALNRVTNKSSSGASGVPGFNYTYAYDSPDPNGIGRPWYTTSSSNETEQYYYDAVGRMLKKAMYLPSTPRTPTLVTAVYNLAGNLTDLTYPDGRHIKQSPDGAGQLTQITDQTQTGDNSNTYSYLTASSYWPNGAPQTVWYGNGATAGYHLNNRLQVDEISDVRIGKGSYTGVNVLSEKHLCFGPATSTLSGSIAACPALATGNNGNIWQSQDSLNSTRTQTFSYDNLNRLASFVRADGAMQQTYAYDSFGNLNQTSPGTLQTNLMFGANNQILGDVYDPAGDLTTYSNGVSMTSLIYDAENKLVNVNGGAATYSYDANGDRVRKDVSPNWTEYVRFNGQTVAEKGSDGAWSDYIYASGQRIARADGYDIRIHIHGTNCSGSGCPTNEYGVVTALTAANGYTIRSGDLLVWRQYQSGAAVGGLHTYFSDQTSADQAKRDFDGQLIDADTTMNTWHERVVDLTDHAGKTVAAIDPWDSPNGSGQGDWDIYFGDIALVSTDGTSIPLYSRTMMSLSGHPGDGVTNYSAVTEKVSDNNPLTTTTYYHGDQVGSTHLLTSGAGWPISSETYYPFGAEATPTADSNHYKFTGEERDAESWLDSLGARQYSFTMGRFMSPDPSQLRFADPTNPQSLNLYSYVMNNPLKFVDPTGLALQISCADIWQPWQIQEYGPDGSVEDYSGGDFSQQCNVYDDGTPPPTLHSQSRQPSSTSLSLAPKNATPWYKNPCIQSALAKGAASTALDAVGLLPEGGAVSAAFSLWHGAAGVSNGTKILERVQFGAGLISTANAGSDVSGSEGAFSLSGAQALTGAATIGAGLLKAAPVVGQVLSGISVAGDLYGTYKAVAGCHP